MLRMLLMLVCCSLKILFHKVTNIFSCVVRTQSKRGSAKQIKETHSFKRSQWSWIGVCAWSIEIVCANYDAQPKSSPNCGSPNIFDSFIVSRESRRMSCHELARNFVLSCAGSKMIREFPRSTSYLSLVGHQNYSRFHSQARLWRRRIVNIFFILIDLLFLQRSSKLIN